MWKLYSLRWSTARGWQWRIERDNMIADDAYYWLRVYRDDEPRVTFTISKSSRKPNLPKLDTARTRAPTILGR